MMECTERDPQRGSAGNLAAASRLANLSLLRASALPGRKALICRFAGQNGRTKREHYDPDQQMTWQRPNPVIFAHG